MNRFLSLLLATAVAVISTAASAQAPSTLHTDPAALSGDSAITGAMESFRSGRYAEAADLFAAAVASYPNYPRAAILLANAQFALGRFEDAGARLTKALMTVPQATREADEIRDSWRDFLLFERQIGELGRLSQKNPENRNLKLLYAFYYGIAGYSEYKDQLLRSIPKAADESKAVSTILATRMTRSPWVDLPPPLFAPEDVVNPYNARSAPRPDTMQDFTRHMTAGVGLGAAFITGELSRSRRSNMNGYLGSRFWIGAIIDSFEIDFDFGWTGLRGAVTVPSAGLIKHATFNLYSFSVIGVWHPLTKPGKKGFDPSIRLGYSFQDLELGYGYWDTYPFVTSTIALGQGPLAGISLDYTFSLPAIDISLGVDSSFQALFLRDSGGNALDGALYNLQGKLGFRF